MIPIAAGGRRVWLGALVTASLFQVGLAAFAAFCVQLVFDEVLSHRAPAGAPGPVTVAGLFCAAALVAAAVEIFRTWAGEKLGLSYTADVRAALFSRVMHASPEALSQKRQGALLLPFVGDLTAMKKWVGDGLVRLISASVMSVGLIAALAWQSPPLAIAAGSIVALAATALIWLSTPLSKAIRTMRARRGAVANFVDASIRTARTVQAFRRFPREAARLEKRNAALVRAGLDLARWSGITAAILHTASMALIGATLAVGVYEARAGALSPGAIAGALSVAGLLAGAVRDLGLAFETWRRGQVAFDKARRALSIAPSLTQGDISSKAWRDARPELQLENLAVEGAFKRFSAIAKKGAIILVEGDDAARSALMATCVRLKDPDRGRVRVNGRNLRRAPLEDVARRIGFASPAAPLLRGSIAMNLRYRHPEASAKAVARVEAVCNLAPIYARLPDGRDTRLSDGALELTLGERQRLKIARAMLGSPSLLVLDDVDSHLDELSAAAIAAALRAYPGVVLMAASHALLRAEAHEIWKCRDGVFTIAAPATRPENVVPLALPNADVASDKKASP